MYTSSHKAGSAAPGDGLSDGVSEATGPSLVRRKERSCTLPCPASGRENGRQCGARVLCVGSLQERLGVSQPRAVFVSPPVAWHCTAWG